MAVGKLDTNAHKAPRRLGQCHHAEPERHTEVNVPFVEANLAYAEERRVHAAAARCRPAAAAARPDCVRGPGYVLEKLRISSVMRIPPPDAGRPNGAFLEESLIVR